MIETIHVLENSNEKKDSIYLAGPTYRITKDSNNPKSWRDDAVKIFKEEIFDGIIYVPEWKNGIRPKEWTYSRQIDWEIDKMGNCDIILFWIPRDLETLPGFTTNIEFGEWLHSDKIVIGGPKDSPKNRYLIERCSRLGISWYYSFQECIFAVISMIQDKKDIRRKIWFTADTHFSHKRTLELSKRPFNTIKEMDWEIIKNWNELISNNDTVYHLGDFGNPEMIRFLNGKKINFLPGNYDDEKTIKSLKKDPRVNLIKQNHLEVYNGNEFRLIHIPINAFYSSYFYLYGHIHKLQMVKKNGLNIGVDCHNFKPINLETVLFYKNAILNHYDQNVFLNEI